MNQLFTPLTEPVGALWGLMVLGALWLLYRRQWRSAFWLGLPTFLLFIIGSTSLTELLVAHEECQWMGTAEVGEHTIEVGKSEIKNQKSEMGGGQRISKHHMLGFAISDGGSRILTAIELVRLGKAKTLVLGGSWPMPDHPEQPSSGAIHAWVTDWGLVGGAVTNLGVCINTHDESLAFGKLARSQGWSKILLVTSAFHMRRSLALFKPQCIEVEPVAADFQVLGVPQDLQFSPFPRLYRLCLLSLYLHEKIGWWVYRARGWV